MLPAANRLSDPDLFRAASRRGRRASARSVVTHLLCDQARQASGVPARPDDAARVGFVVSKAVGNAVDRNRVKRRLRHAMRERIAPLPGDAVLVVRAQPSAGRASYPELVADLDRCLERVLTGQRAGQEA